MPAEYNPFGNKAILRGSQSEVGSAGSQRRAQPHLVPPGPLIPLRPNSPAQGGAPATPERPERPFRPDRPDLQPARPGSAGKHHLDSHIHTVDRASIPAPAPALAPVGHHQGSHGHGHNHAGTGHDFSLKAAKPTELLEQVNKDQIIDVQAEVAVVADPAIHRDEDNRDKVLLAPATSPPSSDARPGAAGGGPVAGAAGGEWHLAWTAQVYGLATMWGVLTGLCMVAAVLVDSRTRLVPRVHFNMLLALLLAVALANSYSLFFDVINYDKLQLLQQMQQQEAPQTSAAAPAAGAPAAEVEEAAAALRVPQLLADVSLPFLPAAFSVFFFVVLRVNHVPCGSSGVPQTPAFLVLLFLFLATTMSLEVASFAVAVARGARSNGGLCIAARGLTVCGSALLGLAYLVVYRPLRRAAAKKQAEQLRAAYTAFRRLPTPALPRVVNALLVCALLLMGLAGLTAYRLMDVTLVGSNTDWSLPPWWYLRLAEHVGSLLVGFLLLWCATRGPSRGADERATSTASRSSRGTSGALSLVSRNGMRFLFDCPSTGSEENKTSEDNTYPTVCASNHAILNYTQHTGNKLYDDSFPLANVHSAPLNSSGDDFCNVPTMPKRAERAERASRTATVTAGPGKAGTLGPYSKGSRRAAAPGPGHHTLGPGGQLYDADDREARDTLRKGSRTTGRTRRTRLGRHHQEVYSNCPQDDVDLDGLADEFTVFKQYNNSTGSSESADNYDVPMLVSAPAVDARDAKRHRRRDRNGGVDEDGRVIGALQHGGGGHPRSKAVRHGGPADSLSPASPSDLSDCDRLSSNRSSYDEAAPPALRHAVPHPNHHANHHHHHHHRGKAGKLLYDASEDDVTPDSAVVADITTSSPRTGGLHSPRDKRPGRRLARRHQHLSQESPSSPELHDTVWSPQ